MSKKDIKGITVKKEEDFGEWYTQVIEKADLADYTSVSGCMALKPTSYAIWEKIQQLVDQRLKKAGVQNVSFPLLIPEKLLQKEARHVAGFSPEVAWVTHAGNAKLPERLAVRPTSEAIMYESFSKWIRSHNDLPLRYNQWNNVVRWEFKHPTPFLRTREFLWNEGHSCFASKEEAEQEGNEIMGIYAEVCENFLALPFLMGKKSEQEKFAGAEYTISTEFLLPTGKAVQGPDFHHDGQNFATAFEITFLDDNGKRQFVWQNTWAISTRMLGVLFAIHGDDKGLVLPPRIAPTQIVIVPILFDDSKKKVLEEAHKVKKQLEKKYSIYLDEREGYSAGWKFNEWEVKGVPIRIEIGPKDLEKKQMVLVRRDTGEKEIIKFNEAEKKIKELLEKIQENLYHNAEKNLKNSIVSVDTLMEAQKALEHKKIIFAPWCSTVECEEKFKEKTGAKSLNSPFKHPLLKKGQSCFACKNAAKTWFYFGKSY